MKVLYVSPKYNSEIITHRYLHINPMTGKVVVSETVRTEKSNYTYRAYELPESDYPTYSQAINKAQEIKFQFPYCIELEENLP